MTIRRITEEEVRSLWVQRLPDAPNRTGRYGTPGMSAAEVKAAYDALALRIVERYNELVDAVVSGELLSALPSGKEGDTLADFFADVRSGALATYLTVDGERALSALAAAFDCHNHDGAYVPLVNGRIDASLLPDKYESVFAEAEAERAAAEAERLSEEEERAIAEARREALMDAFRETIAAIEAREEERNRFTVDALEMADIAQEAALTAARETLRLQREVASLRAAAEGVLYEQVTDARPLYRKEVPEGTLPYAAVAAIGGGVSGATALEIPDGSTLLTSEGEVCGYAQDGILCQTARPGAGSSWGGIPLILESGATYTIGFDIFVDAAIPESPYVNYSFAIARDGAWLICLSVSCAERGTWVRRRVTFRAPSRLTEDGYLATTGELFLGYTGADAILGTGIRFRHVSIAKGTEDRYIPRTEGRGVVTTAVLSHGANLIPFPYPALHSPVGGLTVRTLEDGSLLINGVAERNISYELYTDAHGLSLPPGEVYVHGTFGEGVKLLLKTGLNVRLEGECILTEEDEYHGHYFLYLYILEGTVFENTRLLPFVCRGGKREPTAYHPPYRYEIPAEVLALPGYGVTGNVLDLSEGVYRQTVDSDGNLLSGEVVTPLPEDFVAGCLLPVEEGGCITLENADCEGVDSTLIFETKRT